MRAPDPSAWFEGSPCRVCGGTARYKSTSRCVACRGRRQKAAYLRDHARHEPKTPAKPRAPRIAEAPFIKPPTEAQKMARR